jgi:polyferredoxin
VTVSFKRFGLPASLFLFLLSVSPLAAQQGQGRRATFLSVLARPKFLVMLALGLIACALLLSKKMKNSIKIPFLLLTTFLFGLAPNLPVAFFKKFSMHPSPVCAATKSILYGLGIPLLVTLAVIVFLTLLGPKLYCGWVCPVGAIQELIAMLSDKLRIKRVKWNFVFTQTVRILIFLAFVFLSGTAIYHTFQEGQKVALSIYDPINAFHGFEFTMAPWSLSGFLHYLPLLLSLGLAFKTYRPFCYLVCPVGLFTNLLEQVALFRVSRRKGSCDDCLACERKSPCPTVREILKDAVLRPDCFSCTACVNACREKKSLEFGTKRLK